MENLDRKYYKGTSKEFARHSSGKCSVCNEDNDHLCQSICLNCLDQKKGPGVIWETELCFIDVNGKLSEPCGIPPLKKCPKGWQEKIEELRFTPRYQNWQEFFHPICCNDFVCYLGNHDSVILNKEMNELIPYKNVISEAEWWTQIINEDFHIKNNKLTPNKFEKIKNYNTGEISLWPIINGYYYFFSCNHCNKIYFHHDYD